MIAADFGVQASLRFVKRVEDEARRGRNWDERSLDRILERTLGEIFAADGPVALAEAAGGPTVHLLVGVNGVGKTTTAGKIAHHLRNQGKRVLVAAADTYRAGAVEQLERWAERAGAEFLRGQPGGDPAAVAFDALGAARARGIDTVLVDTAGRLHTHGGLMEQLAKVNRVIAKREPGAPHEILLVLDATVGQNGLVQAREFSRFVEVSGIVLTKMDSTARGGIVVALCEELGIPVRLIGTGEALQDLEPFDPDEFVAGLLAADR